MIGPYLDSLATRWCNPDSPNSMSVLLSSTYSLLNIAAKSTNKFRDLSKSHRPRPQRHPHLVQLRDSVLALHKRRANTVSSPDTDAKVLEILTEQLTAARSTYKQALREVQMLDLNTL